MIKYAVRYFEEEPPVDYIKYLTHYININYPVTKFKDSPKQFMKILETERQFYYLDRISADGETLTMLSLKGYKLVDFNYVREQMFDWEKKENCTFHKEFQSKQERKEEYTLSASKIKK